jgi:hypothetical protein
MKRYVGRQEPMEYERWRELGWSEEESRAMEKEGQLEPRVYVEEIGPTGEVKSQRLVHHKLHSPDGFSWGYAGSGCAETARSLLIDHFGGLDQLPLNAFGDPVVPLYQRFKEQFIAGAPEEGFTISDVEIAAWLVMAAEAERVHDDGA